MDVRLMIRNIIAKALIKIMLTFLFLVKNIRFWNISILLKIPQNEKNIAINKIMKNFSFKKYEV